MIRLKLYLLIIALLIPLLPKNLFASRINIDRTIKVIHSKFGVQIHFKYDREEFFPQRWLKSPISAEGKQISPKEAKRILPIIRKFLTHYPRNVITKNLTDIFLSEELVFYGKNFGGSNSKSGLYIQSQSQNAARGVSDEFLLGLLYSEFSSILYRNYQFPKAEWAAVNPNDFKYVGTGRAMLGSKNLYGQTEDLMRKGFLIKYSQSNIENDFNMITRWLFTKRKKLNELCEKYPKIKVKREIAERFYKTISKDFTFN